MQALLGGSDLHLLGERLGLSGAPSSKVKSDKNKHCLVRSLKPANFFSFKPQILIYEHEPSPLPLIYH